jgi:hypothetical protein
LWEGVFVLKTYHNECRQKKKKLLPAGFRFGWNYGEIFYLFKYNEFL